MSESNSNLPIEVDEKSLAIKRLFKNISDFASRAGKTALGVGGLGAGLIVAAGATTLSVPLIPTVALVGRSYFGSKRFRKCCI
jgi:hypothetical protein